MLFFMRLLGTLTSIYMLLLFIRILLAWFSGPKFGRPVELLCRITDPYLNWFRRFPSLRAGTLDFSPAAALGLLSVLNNICITLGYSGSITLGRILALLLSTVWSAVSFFLGFAIIVLVLRLAAYLSRQNVYQRPIWGIIDAFARPILFRIKQIFFPNRLVNYLFGIVFSIAALLLLMLGLGFAVRLGVYFLQGLRF